jgi:hypothetical protein
MQIEYDPKLIYTARDKKPCKAEKIIRKSDL